MSGKILVAKDRCKGCSLCISACPREILALSQKPNPKGYYTAEIRDESQCTACSFCALMCPDMAIEVFKL